MAIRFFFNFIFWATACLSTHLLKDVWVISSFLAIVNKTAVNTIQDFM